VKALGGRTIRTTAIVVQALADDRLAESKSSPPPSARSVSSARITPWTPARVGGVSRPGRAPAPAILSDGDTVSLRRPIRTTR
jgi:hypothetical protein